MLTESPCCLVLSLSRYRPIRLRCIRESVFLSSPLVPPVLETGSQICDWRGAGSFQDPSVSTAPGWPQQKGGRPLLLRSGSTEPGIAGRAHSREQSSLERQVANAGALASAHQLLPSRILPRRHAFQAHKL